MTAGVIAAGDSRTAEAGAELLRAGGNAVDVICAASCMAFIAEAPLCGPGGSGALLAGPPDDLRLLDFFAVVPGQGASAPPVLDFHDVDVDFGPTVQQFHVGRGAAAVPGTMLGLVEAHRRLGRVPFSTLIQPALRAAREGLEPSAQLREVVRMLRPILSLSQPTRALFYDAEDRPWLSNPRLADFLEAVAHEGEALLRGPFARDLVAQMGPEHGGLLTATDLQRYAPVWREPLRVRRGAHEYLSNPPPSSGGSLVGLGLALSAELPLGGMPWLGPRYVGELASLLGALDHAKQRSRELPPGQVMSAELHDGAARALAEQRARRSLGSTTHISVLDGDGRLASLTMSNGEGCGHTLPAYGVHVNNFLGEEDINPHGFHRQPPGTWMTTMMAPSAVLEGGRPSLVLGTGGSNRIRSALLQTLLHVLAAGRSLEEAVLAPRMHVEGERLWVEREGLPEGSVEALCRAWPGATVFPAHNMFFGGVHAVGLAGAGLYGMGDPRRGGTVVRVG
ncbi:MAG: gamma-glutamyltransferase [Myxococcales bacterium]|nr:gamma-glutamyltransferase [Myxococcales bacterium]